MLQLPMNEERWHKRFLSLAKEYGSWSKDPSTQVGAVAVDEESHRVLSAGYNGFPRGIEDTNNRLNHKDTKYSLVVHAEMNAIYNATHNGISLNGSTLYINGLPCCSDCAKGVIQVGIKKVVMPQPHMVDPKWEESWNLTKKMFNEAGVKFGFVDV